MTVNFCGKKDGCFQESIYNIKCVKMRERFEMTESENMRQGRWYDAQFDEKLLKQRLFAEDLCFDLNSYSSYGSGEARSDIEKVCII